MPTILASRPSRPLNRAVRARLPRRYYGQGTFDAGGPCSLGIPTVMYGAKNRISAGTDFVPISEVLTEARVLARLIMRELA